MNTQRKKRRKTPVIYIAAVIVIVVAGAVYIMGHRDVSGIAGIADLTEINVGEEITPDYSVRPIWLGNEKLSFASGDEWVFTVDKRGVIRGEHTGEAILEIKAGNYTREVVISVLPVVTDITGIDEPIKLKVGESVTLKPEVKPENCVEEKVEYAVSDTSIASADDKGVVKGIAAGEVMLLVSAGGYSKTVKVVVSE